MATPSAAIAIPPFPELEELQVDLKPPTAAVPSSSSSTTSNTLIIDKTLESAANLVKLLPSSTVLVFEALSSSFTNRGDCYASNKFLTAALLCLGVASCLVFSFTDSFVGRGGKHYYGLATPRGFYVFNRDAEEGEGEGEALRARPLDYVHGLLSAALFLTLAFSDLGVQGCFFPEKSGNKKQLVENLPLGVGVLATLLFALFPTTRKGVGALPLH